jgi:hypothetical protein
MALKIASASRLLPLIVISPQIFIRRTGDGLYKAEHLNASERRPGTYRRKLPLKVGYKSHALFWTIDIRCIDGFAGISWQFPMQKEFELPDFLRGISYEIRQKDVDMGNLHNCGNGCRYGEWNAAGVEADPGAA